MQTCLREIKVYGELADFCGYKSLTADVKTAADAIKCLIGNNPELEPHMCSRYYKVIVEDNPITIEELHYPAGRAPIKIVPVVSGEGGRGLGQILLGALLIGGSFVFGGLRFSQLLGPIVQPGSLAAAGGFTKAAFGIGAALTLSGVSDMLFPLPDIPDFSNEEDPRISFSFSGVQNTSRAGTSIPLCYGEIVTGSVVISAGIDTHQIIAEED